MTPTRPFLAGGGRGCFLLCQTRCTQSPCSFKARADNSAMEVWDWQKQVGPDLHGAEWEDKWELAFVLLKGRKVFTGKRGGRMN